jgi:hypothetical protein
MVMGFRGAVTVLWLAWVSAGCFGLGKRDDAAEELSRQLRGMERLMEQPSNLTRESNAATLARLQKLFPAAMTHETHRSLDELSSKEFHTLYATGLNRAVTADGRPTTSIAQIGLRKWAAKLCTAFATSTAPGALFSTDGILLDGESMPEDAAQRLAFAAARNAWLHPYPADSIQVGTLATAYRDALAISGDASARKVVCMSALMAPQFWLGNPGPEDIFRRVALEVGRYVPTMRDFQEFRAGRLPLTRLVERLQQDASYRPAYLDTVKDWHRAWWGLRDFQNSFEWGEVENYGYRRPQMDPRADTLGRGWTFSHFYDDPRAFLTGTLPDGVPLIDVGSQTYAYRYNLTDYAIECVSQVNGAPNLQPFDPRTTLILFEHRHPTIARWEVVGAFVHSARLAEFEAIVKAYDASYAASSRCTLHKTLYPEGNFFRKHVTGFPEYYECDGSVSLPGGGFRRVGLRDFQHNGIGSNTNPATSAERPQSYTPDFQGKDGTGAVVVKANRLVGTVHETFHYATHRRIRRKSPSGWQNGISAVRGWYTGAPLYACNAFTRHFMSCTFRPPSHDRENWKAHQSSSWADVSSFPHEGAVNSAVHDGAFFSISTAANPHILNQFRCGTPRTDLMAASGSMATTYPAAMARERELYPQGYGLDDAAYLDTTPPGSLNEQMNNAALHIGSYHYMIDTSQKTGTPDTLQPVNAALNHPEIAGIDRLNRDLNLEPLRLLQHVLDNGLPYSELFTADYTLGHEELDLFYRTQAFLMPAHPPGYSPSAPTAPARTQLRAIRRATNPGVPVSWFFPFFNWTPEYVYPPMDETLHYAIAAWSPRVRESGVLPALVSSGILSMPAFLGPVTGKMRTVASRFFTRLLCGEPSVFAPNESQRAIHREFMHDPANPESNRTAALHLDETKGCFSCHVNLDPLSSALSAHFLDQVQVNEWTAQSGEFRPVGGNFRGGTVHYFLGARAGGDPGEGAFLGSRVNGVRGVGRVLADSDLAYSCVVQRTYQEIMGRPPVLADSRRLRDLISQFRSHKNYDRMVREIVALPGFGAEP